MKKSLLALAVAALAAASTVSATTVYDKDGTTLGFHGRVQSVFYSGNQDKAKDEKATVNASGRFGIDLRSQITSGAAAFAMGEWDMSDGQNRDNFSSRHLYAGVDFGQFGTITVGRFDPAGKYGMFATDVFDDYGCYGYSGNDDKRSGTVQYQWSGYGFTALASYAFAEDTTTLDGAYYTKENVDTKYDIGIGLGYETQDILFGPIIVRASFNKTELNNDDKDNKDPFAVNEKGNFVNSNAFKYKDPDTGTLSNAYYDGSTGYGIGVSWGKLNIGPYVGANYVYRKIDGVIQVKDTSGTHNESMDAKITGYEFAVGYSFANGVTLRTGYQHQKYEDFDGEDYKLATVPVYANWQLTPSFQVWGEARFDAGTDDNKNEGGKDFGKISNGIYGDPSENVYSFGMRYNF